MHNFSLYIHVAYRYLVNISDSASLLFTCTVNGFDQCALLSSKLLYPGAICRSFMEKAHPEAAASKNERKHVRKPDPCSGYGAKKLLGFFKIKPVVCKLKF